MKIIFKESIIIENIQINNSQTNNGKEIFLTFDNNQGDKNISQANKEKENIENNLLFKSVTNFFDSNNLQSNCKKMQKIIHLFYLRLIK